MGIRYYTLPIINIKDETADAYTLMFQNPDPSIFTYKPGQYLTIKVKVGDEELRRAFSFSSSPITDDFLSVTIKRVEGGRVSNYLRDYAKVGDTIQALPPMGKFCIDIDPNNKKHYILIGGGSGITPLMSILKTVLQEEPNSKVTLWYGNRDRASIIFYDQLNALKEQYGDRLTVVHTVDEADENWDGLVGRLDKDRVYQLISDLFMVDEFRKFYYICGPSPMMNAAQAALEKHAVNPFDVFRELYSAPIPTEEEAANQLNTPKEEAGDIQEIIDQTITVLLDDETHSIHVKASEYILDATIEADIDPPYACQTGICTTCRAKLLSGIVSMDETEGLSDDELKEGYILTCQAHPISSDVEIEFG